MSTTTQKLTAEELFEMPDHSKGCELVRGELVIMTPGGFGHGYIGLRFGSLLMFYVSAHKLGVVVGAETGFILSRNPDTVLAPDVAFVRQERIAGQDWTKYWDGAPDLATEVVSPTDRASAVDDKTQDYLDAGTIEVIVIDPKTKSVRICRQGQPAIILGPGEILENLETVPGFRCTVDEILATH